MKGLEDPQMETGFCAISPPSPHQLLLNVTCSAHRVYREKEASLCGAFHVNQKCASHPLGRCPASETTKRLVRSDRKSPHSSSQMDSIREESSLAQEPSLACQCPHLSLLPPGYDGNRARKSFLLRTRACIISSV